MSYIDGFVAAVPTNRKEEYIQHAAKAAECSVDETVVFSWVLWPSREARDRGMELIENDARMNEDPMPFDGSRLIYGGFQMVLDA